ncbi:NifB/NifX family molybdenum-iron cluster-binding protein [Cellulomonas hominis]
MTGQDEAVQGTAGQDDAVVVCVPVGEGRQVGHGWGRAARLAVVRVRDGKVVDWTEHDVRWDVLHDSTTEGGHHARVVRFLRDEHVDVVVANHMGPPMARMLATMGLRSVLGAAGDAEQAVLAAAALEG